MGKNHVTFSGFALHEASDLRVTWDLVFLLLALLCWLVGIYKGLNFLRLNLDTLYLNYQFLNHKYNHEHKAEESNESLHSVSKTLVENSDRANKDFGKLFNCLYMGVILYICWFLANLFLDNPVV
jgi:hypothetical protein